jgi:hypothetical protein
MRVDLISINNLPLVPFRLLTYPRRPSVVHIPSDIVPCSIFLMETSRSPSGTSAKSIPVFTNVTPIYKRQYTNNFQIIFTHPTTIVQGIPDPDYPWRHFFQHFLSIILTWAILDMRTYPSRPRLLPRPRFNHGYPRASNLTAKYQAVGQLHYVGYINAIFPVRFLQAPLLPQFGDRGYCSFRQTLEALVSAKCSGFVQFTAESPSSETMVRFIRLSRRAGSKRSFSVPVHDRLELMSGILYSFQALFFRIGRSAAIGTQLTTFHQRSLNYGVTLAAPQLPFTIETVHCVRQGLDVPSIIRHPPYKMSEDSKKKHPALSVCMSPTVGSVLPCQ